MLLLPFLIRQYGEIITGLKPACKANDYGKGFPGFPNKELTGPNLNP
jgi:hypothetical protein